MHHMDHYPTFRVKGMNMWATVAMLQYVLLRSKKRHVMLCQKAIDEFRVEIGLSVEGFDAKE